MTGGGSLDTKTLIDEEIKMRLAYDLQACQTRFAERGVGRYTQCLGQAMQELLLARGETMQALLHADLPGNIPALRRAFCGAEFRYLHTAGDSVPSALSACLTADAYRSLSADAVCVGFPFENPPDYTGLPLDYRLTGKFIAGIFYDLIPLLFPKRYGMLYSHFQAGLPRVKSMNLLLAISETTRQDAIRCMELEPWQIVNISSGVSESFRKVRIEDEAGLLRRYGLGQRFVMYTGGNDWRKNHEGLIEAWARLDEALRSDCQLAIVCEMPAQEKLRLLQLASHLGMKPGELVLTGFVPDEDLVALYNLTTLFVFPSLYEGFGLPIVEAMRCGAPVIGGDNSSIREIIQREEALFDASNRDSMAAALERGLSDEGFRQHLRDWGAKRGRDFSWKRSAELALAAIDEGVARWQAEKVAKKAGQQIPGKVLSAGASSRHLPRLAWVSPMPPDKSGIALWSQDLLPYIRHYYDVDVYTRVDSCPAGQGGGLKPGCSDWHELPFHAADYEMIVYQMGDSHFHDYMLYLIECCPGIMVQHDFHLSHMLHWRGHIAKDYSLYEQHMFYSHGWQGLKAMLAAEPGDMDVMNAYPSNKRILDKALQVIFLSESMIDWTRKAYGEEYVHRLAPAVVPTMILHRELIERNVSADDQARIAMRKKYGFDSSDFLIMTFGLIGELKNPELLIDAVRLMTEKAEGTDVKLVFAGSTTDRAYLETLCKRASSPAEQSWFRITGFLSHEEYCDYLLMADCAVQLCKASINGPSGAVMECMLAGVPVVVSREAGHGWPQGLVCELQTGAGAEQLSEILEELRRDEGKRREQSKKARAYVREHNAPEKIALAYKQQIEKAKGKLEELAQDSFIEQAGKALSEAGVSPEACLSMAECHELNWQAAGFRRVYACLPDSEVRALRDSEPRAMRLDRMCELISCRWDVEQREFLVDMPVYDGSVVSRVAPLTEMDAVILPCEGWTGQAAARAGQCLASVYLTGEAQLLQDLAAQLSGSLAGSLPFGRIADFWAQGWALRDILPGEGRLLIDTSYFTYSEDKGSIQRLCTNLGMELCNLGEPVFVRQLDGHLVTNRAYARRIEGDSVSPPQEESYVKFRRGDVLFLLDPVWGQTDAFRPLLEDLRRAGGRAYTVVHDLFPLTHPEWFNCSAPEPIFRCWHEFAMRECDGLLCDSRATADSVAAYMLEHGIQPRKELGLHYFPCGAAKLSGEGEARPLLRKFLADDTPVFLMVGVINPRKGYDVALGAFCQFWQQGGKAKLLIIGRHLFSPEIEESIVSVPGYGKRLLWLKDATDAELLYSYQNASCYLTASLDEGFGLPLTEAASYGMPVICSDIPVFREIGQGHADYFAVGDANALCQLLHEWLASDKHPDASQMHIVSWQESAGCVMDILQGKQKPYMTMGKMEKEQGKKGKNEQAG